MAERSVKVIISAVDRLTAPINKINNALKPMEQGVKRVNDNLKNTEDAAKRVTGAVGGTSGAFSKFGRNMSRTSAEATRAIGKMGAFAAANDNLAWKLTRTAAAAGAALGAMGAYSATVDRADRSVRRFSMDRMVAGLRRMQSAAQTAGRHLSDLVGHASRLGAVSGVAAAAATAYLGRAVIRTSADFEKFGITLETVMGDKGKAADALKWVSDFATKTPYELKETTEAFVKLKNYGIDPMKGTLENAGNAAAILGKPLNQAVEAIADAMTGENERLKEFGITASIEGKKIQYNWVENGKAMTAFAQKNSRDQMLAVINGIWNRQYKGGMDKLSMTWDGMVSNMQDAWTRILQQIGDAGLFDFLKTELKGVLDYVNELQSSGKLKEWATGVSRAATEMLKRFKAFVTGIDWKDVYSKFERIAGVVGRLADIVGGPLNLGLLTIGAITFGPLITSMTMLAVTLIPALVTGLPLLRTAIMGVSAAMWANPAALMLGAFVALAAAAYYVGRNWDQFKGKFTAIWKACSDAVARAWGRIKDAYSTFGRDIMSFFDTLWTRFKEAWFSAWDGVVTKTSDAFQSVVDYLNNFDMLAVGKDLIQRMWDGMKANWGELKKWFKKKIKDLFNFWGNKGEDGDPETTGFGAYARGSGSQPGGPRTSMGQGGTGTGGDAVNPGGGVASDKEGRGGANLMHGQYGGVGENQTQIVTKSGKKVTVHKDAAPSFKGFLDELEGMGYKINSLGGLAMRGKAGGGSGWSQHAYGNAIDINPAKNPFYRPKPGQPVITDMPPNISDIAAKHGLSWGGDWKSVKDAMHFEWRGTTPEQRAKAAELKKLDEAKVGADAKKHPFAKMAEYVQSRGGEKPADPTADTGGSTDLRGKPGYTPGMQNNNYGNLKYFEATARKRYPGVVGPSSNRDEGTPQIVFKSLEDGVQAAVNMAKRLSGEGKNTVNKMVSDQGGWTPGKKFASKNIAGFMGIGPDDEIDLSKPETMKRFIKAMGRQEHGINPGTALDKKMDAIVDGILAPQKKAAGAASPTGKSPEATKAEVEKKADGAGFDAARKAAGPNGSGVAAAAKAGEAKGLTAGATHYNPQITVTGVSDKEIPKKIERVTAGHARDMKQRQREALHD